MGTLIFGKVKSKQSIRILIALMSMALIGVIVIQFLWIRNAISMKQEQFDRSVRIALMAASADLESKYGLHFLTEKLETDSSARKEVQKQDPDFYRFIISFDKDNNVVTEDIEGAMPSPEAVELPIDENDETVMSKIDCDKGQCAACTDKDQTPRSTRVYRQKMVTVLNVNNTQQDIVINKGVYMAPPPPACAPAKPAQPALEVNEQCQLMNVVKGAADEYAISKMSPKMVSHVIDSPRIKAALIKEFEKQHLPQKFDFATYCVDGDTLMINKASSLNPMKDYTYKSPLLATDFVKARSLLLVKFPQHMQYLFASVAGMLLLSLFFTLAIISAFTYSLHVIFSQKKLTDITNDFINNMTHELKTPLATISMTADTLGLQAVNQTPEMVNEYAGMIKNEVKKLSRHVDRILEAALLEKNGKATGAELVDMNRLVEEEIKLFEPLVKQHGGTIEAEVSKQSLRVLANKDMLRGAICNLIDNAVKYSSEAPVVKITIKAQPDTLVLCVRDNGIGITKADQKRIFEKFYRAPTGNRHDVKGFGLGLSFVKSVVDNLGGKIWVESDFGAGSSFFVELPIVL